MEAWTGMGQQGHTHATEGSGENGAHLPLETVGVCESKDGRNCAKTTHSSSDSCSCGNIG